MQGCQPNFETVLRGSVNRLYGVIVLLFAYFPIQNLLKIFASKSSVVICPVISPRW